MISYYDSICILSWLSLVILGVLVHENARIARKDKKFFYLTYLLIAASEFAEWAGLRLNGQADELMGLLTLAKFADYILTPIVGGALITQMRLWNIWSKVMVAILGTNVVLQLICVPFGWIFHIDANNCYQMGPLYGVYLTICFLVVLVVTIQFVNFGRTYRRQNRLSLYLLLVLILSSIIMQEILPGLNRTYYIGVTLTSTLLFIHLTEFSQLAADDVMSRQMAQINTDALTGLFSRYAYSQALKECNALKRLPHNFVVISIDVNGLKSVNDSLGHEAGDELIMGAADCIRSTICAYGKCYRTGGDEFIALVQADRAQIAEAIRTLEEMTKDWHGEMVKELHLAVGCALSQDHPELMAEKLVNEADLAMYAEKEAYYQKTGKTRRGHEFA